MDMEENQSRATQVAKLHRNISDTGDDGCSEYHFFWALEVINSDYGIWRFDWGKRESWARLVKDLARHFSGLNWDHSIETCDFQLN